MNKKCPNPLKGEYCPVCGGSYICLQPWRKHRIGKYRTKKYYEKEKK